MNEWVDVLSNNPLFSYLKREELESVQKHFVELSFPKGETVCRMGDEGDTFYIVLSGELSVWSNDGTKPISYLSAGDFFGEISLLQGGKRSATITVSRRARLLALNKESFETYFEHNPKALEFFSRVLCKRLVTVQKGSGPRKATTTISVTGSPGLKGKSLVTSTLAGLILDFTGQDVLIVRVGVARTEVRPTMINLLVDDLKAAPEKLRAEFKLGGLDPCEIAVGVDAGLGRSEYGQRMSTLVAKLTDIFPFMILDIGSEPEALVASIEEFSDYRVEVGLAPGPRSKDAAKNATKVFRVINHFNSRSQVIPISECEPFVLPIDPHLQHSDPSSHAKILRKNPKFPAAIPLHRMARKVLGTTVGIALGGGAAFGLAHIGVLKVLEDNGIPIDLVAGCSFGSMVGVGYAAGVSPDELALMAGRLGEKKRLLRMLDFTMTRPGILAGNQIIAIFSPLVSGTETFDRLAIPCQAIGTDIESGERVSIGSGRLDEAFRASSAVPMIWSPVSHQGHVLVDGGVVDPVPAEVVISMGADICIAVNVVPPLKKGIEPLLSRLYRKANRLNPLAYFGGAKDLPNMFDVIMNSMQTLQHELGNFKAISADVRINPDLTDFTWIEFYRSAELIQAGADAAERALPAIRRILGDKLARTGRSSRATSTYDVEARAAVPPAPVPQAQGAANADEG